MISVLRKRNILMAALPALPIFFVALVGCYTGGSGSNTQDDWEDPVSEFGDLESPILNNAETTSDLSNPVFSGVRDGAYSDNLAMAEKPARDEFDQERVGEQEPPSVTDELDISTQPWVSSLSSGQQIYEDELRFSDIGSPIAGGVEPTPLSLAFEPRHSLGDSLEAGDESNFHEDGVSSDLKVEALPFI